MTDEQVVLTERQDNVLIVTMNRPAQLNALTDEMRELLRAALREARADYSIRAMVLTGAGRGFCSGAAVGARAPEGAPAPPPIPRTARFAWLQEFHHLPIPVIGALNGVAAGAGVGLALACDIRVIDRGTYLFPAFLQRGLAADNGVAYMLAKLIGPARTLQWLWDCNRLPAEAALAAGVVDVVADEGKALETALDIARRWAAGPTLAMGVVKQQVYNALEVPYAQHLVAEELMAARLRATEDVREGVVAFQEKREPRFQGR